MRKLLCGIVLVLLLCGCTVATNGAAGAPSDKCIKKGFEDLPAESSQCGVTFEPKYALNGITARLVDVDGHGVMYLIYDFSLRDSFQLAVPSDEIAVRPYAHRQVVVNRLNDADMVTVLVSDDCEVERIIVFESEGPVCTGIGPEFGQQATAKEVAVMIGQPMTDRLERIAADSGRLTIYEVSAAKSG